MVDVDDFVLGKIYWKMTEAIEIVHASNMKETPLGLKYRCRVLQPMESFAVVGGARKRRVQTTRYKLNKS